MINIGVMLRVFAAAGFLASFFLPPAAFCQDRNFSVSPLPPQASEQRVALVIGNSNYKTAPLTNPVNDARAMTRLLTNAGFKVISRENASKLAISGALREFGDLLRAGGVGLVYYAGHGMQIKGKNYLIPVDANMEREDEVAYEGVDANQVLDKMEAAKNRLNVVILDACRNNPFARTFRSAEGGLAQMEAPVGTLIAFSTAPGSVASDGSGKNGLYTQYLLNALSVPGVKIEEVFKQVRAKVRKDTNGKQIPWESTSLEGDFILTPEPPKPTANGSSSTALKPMAPMGQIPMPALKVSDRWEYQKIDLFSGSVIRQYSLKLKAITADELQFERSAFDRSWNLLRIVEDGKITTKWSPSRPNFAFPLAIGKTWTGQGRIDTAQFSSDHTVEYKVVRQERVAVPAGVFDTLRVEGIGKYKTVRKDSKSGEGTVTHRYWYSPQVGRFVAYEYEESNWSGTINRKERDELLSFYRGSK